VVRSQDLHSRFLDVADGGYMEITVSDDGIGMDEATKSRIFEPFFSTKEPGKGTGLGLSVVYGVVKSHHGLIDVESERGRGTAFHLLFPADRSTDQSAPDPKLKSKKLLGGGETILIAEDEPVLLETIKTSLQEAGYHVLVARDGDEALRVFNHLGRIPDLVVMDADLPKISGVEAFKLMRAARPATKVIFCTGSIDDTLEKKISGWKGGGVLRKPYSASDLMTRIRMVLDGH
jgi:two-component system cell cycle sensor histidine kinase/response regulator CckA